MQTSEILTLILMPLAVGIVATRLRKQPAVLYWSVAVAIAGAVSAILSATAVGSGPNAGMVGAVVFGAAFCGVPTVAAFVVTRRFFVRFRPVTAVVMAGIRYVVIGLIAVSVAVTAGLIKP